MSDVRRCALDGCESEHYGRGFCKIHYNQQYRAGALPPKVRPTLTERYMAKVTAGSNGCWGWSGAVNNHGYGKLGKSYAHRVSWEIHFGAIPKGMEVMHACDNPPCTNPKHLQLGTHAANMADARLKGRLPGNSSPGEKHPSAKLTWDDVRQIRALRAQGVPRRQVARQFGLNINHVTDITMGRVWKDAA